jgi:CHASE2 domain-containing sensor protein
MADSTLKKEDSSKRANRTIWIVTAIVAALILLIAALSWVNLHLH